MADTLRSVSNPENHGIIVINPDGSNIGQQTPTSTLNPSETITETLVGSVLTTVIQKTIGATVYTKTIVENFTTGVTTITQWS